MGEEGRRRGRENDTRLQTHFTAHEAPRTGREPGLSHVCSDVWATAWPLRLLGTVPSVDGDSRSWRPSETLGERSWTSLMPPLWSPSVRGLVLGAHPPTDLHTVHPATRQGSARALLLGSQDSRPAFRKLPRPGRAASCVLLPLPSRTRLGCRWGSASSF